MTVATAIIQNPDALCCFAFPCLYLGLVNRPIPKANTNSQCKVFANSHESVSGNRQQKLGIVYSELCVF